MNTIITDGDLERLLPLTPAEFQILLALVDGERHGYSIMLEIAAQTNGSLQIGPGTLYGTIKRMLGRGWIVEAGDRPDPQMDDQRRRYYRLTDLGRRVVAADAQRLARLVEEARAKRILPAS